MTKLPSLAIGIITYQRHGLLRSLLESLQAQTAPDGVAVRIVVVDNAPIPSAQEACSDIDGPYPVEWAHEPEPGIPAARQASVELTRQDDWLVFIDDDERATSGWLVRLLSTMQETGADVVTGPVQGILPPEAPRWARYSDVYTSVNKHQTGDRLDKAYTNNTIVTREVLDSVQPSFHSAFKFTGSSDLHFFLRVAQSGFTILWDNEAVVTETVPQSRLSLGWLTRRAFRSGAGDTISRRLINPGVQSWFLCAGLGAARLANGLLLMVPGILNPRLQIKGLRRVASGIGSWAGLFGINHQEYVR